MAVLKMQRITICALKKNRKAILEKLQSLGVLEVNHILDEDEDFRKMDTEERKTGFEKAAAWIRRWIFWSSMRRRRDPCSRRWKGRS